MWYFLKAETDQLEKDAEIFENTDEGKEQGNLVDYGWANIGSFDDLDRIFRYLKIAVSFSLYSNEA